MVTFPSSFEELFFFNLWRKKVIRRSDDDDVTAFGVVGRGEGVVMKLIPFS